LGALQTADERESYLSDFQQTLDQPEPGSVRDLRQAGMETFAEMGFPAPRTEDWKYTSLQPISSVPFRQAAAGDASRVCLEELASFCHGAEGWTNLVFVDGTYCPRLSSPEGAPQGLRVRTMQDALASEDAGLMALLGKLIPASQNGFAALNAAFLRDGALIDATPGAQVEKPVHLVFVSAAGARTAVYPRIVVSAGAGSSLTVVESFFGMARDAYLTDSVTELSVGEGAQVEYYRVQHESVEGFHISQMQVRQQADSFFSATTVNAGGRLVRNALNVVLDGERCQTTLNGLTMVDGERHVDNHTVIDHARPSCESRELYKAVLDGRARSVFSGRIIVRPDAQQTDASQTCRNLLLSTNATVDARPQLEIFADDVKCTHGATVGQLSEEELFYLRSRGLDQAVATQLLTFGFANDIIARIKPEPIRAYLELTQLQAAHAAPDLKEFYDHLRS